MSKILCSTCVIFVTTLMVTSACANTTLIEEKPAMPQKPLSPATVPSVYVQTHSRVVTVDSTSAVLTRYIRKDGRNANLRGEHFSMVVSNNGVLKGFANMSLDLVDLPLPSRERAEQIARAFLQEKAPDLLKRMKISWIAPHDETLVITQDGGQKRVTLTGMKVKMHNLADGLWFWVIVGGDEKPMVFERDIAWITFPGKRQTEKWLHDGWLIEHPPTVE